MASETATRTDTEIDDVPANWTVGLLAGIVGGLLFGTMLSTEMTPVIEVAIPSMYGLAPPANGAVGWIVHMSHSAVLGVAFAGVLALAEVRGDAPATTIGLGLLYGVVLWVVLAALIMPVWLDVVGSPANPPLPNVSTTSLLGHAVYGIGLGVAYVAIERW
jgi:hypothetical protein